MANRVQFYIDAGFSPEDAEGLYKFEADCLAKHPEYKGLFSTLIENSRELNAQKRRATARADQQSILLSYIGITDWDDFLKQPEQYYETIAIIQRKVSPQEYNHLDRLDRRKYRVYKVLPIYIKWRTPPKDKLSFGDRLYTIYLAQEPRREDEPFLFDFFVCDNSGSSAPNEVSVKMEEKIHFFNMDRVKFAGAAKWMDFVRIINELPNYCIDIDINAQLEVRRILEKTDLVRRAPVINYLRQFDEDEIEQLYRILEEESEPLNEDIRLQDLENIGDRIEQIRIVDNSDGYEESICFALSTKRFREIGGSNYLRIRSKLFQMGLLIANKSRRDYKPTAKSTPIMLIRAQHLPLLDTTDIIGTDNHVY